MEEIAVQELKHRHNMETLFLLCKLLIMEYPTPVRCGILLLPDFTTGVVDFTMDPRVCSVYVYYAVHWWRRVTLKTSSWTISPRRKCVGRLWSTEVSSCGNVCRLFDVLAWLNCIILYSSSTGGVDIYGCYHRELILLDCMGVVYDTCLRHGVIDAAN